MPERRGCDRCKSSTFRTGGALVERGGKNADIGTEPDDGQATCLWAFALDSGNEHHDPRRESDVHGRKGLC